MTNDKILEIARRYTVPKEESSILIDEGGNPTGETLTLMMWNFCEEELLAFSKSVIEADRESSDEPFGDFGLVMELCAALEIASYSIQDEEAKQSAIGACNYGRNRVKDRRPVPTRKPLSDEEIRTIMLGHGFTIKDGCEDLKPYVYAAVRAIEKAHGIGETE